jgi:hypothetical protein
LYHNRGGACTDQINLSGYFASYRNFASLFLGLDTLKLSDYDYPIEIAFLESQKEEPSKPNIAEGRSREAFEDNISTELLPSSERIFKSCIS